MDLSLIKLNPLLHNILFLKANDCDYLKILTFYMKKGKIRDHYLKYKLYLHISI